MKKEYQSPVADKIFFSYVEQIAASNCVCNVKNGHAWQSCYKHNGNEKIEHK